MFGLLSRVSDSFRNKGSQDSDQQLDSYASVNAAPGNRSIDDCQPGAHIEIVGVVKVLPDRSLDQPPAVEIEVFDSTGVIRVIWLGRRKIPGIVEGRTIKICGRLTCNTEQPTIFNPRYELRPIKQ
jgi:hypothetical protein